MSCVCGGTRCREFERASALKGGSTALILFFRMDRRYDDDNFLFYNQDCPHFFLCSIYEYNLYKAWTTGTKYNLYKAWTTGTKRFVVKTEGTLEGTLLLCTQQVDKQFLLRSSRWSVGNATSRYFVLSANCDTAAGSS